MKKILATSILGKQRLITLPINISDILKLNEGDQILFTIGENNDIVLMGPIVHIPFIAHVIGTTPYGEYGMITIPKIVTEILELKKRDQILFIADEKGNLILRGPILQIPFIAYVLGTITYIETGIITIPKNVTEILKLKEGDQILFLNGEDRIILRVHPKDSLEVLGTSKIRDLRFSYLPINVAKILKLNEGDQILFAIDENNDIIIIGPIIHIPFIARVLDSTIYREKGLATITKIIADILKIEKKDQILFLLDEKGDVILTGPIID